ncbi:hypothetical protein LCGC14_2561780 [marine sediment metagenome]|uniref:Uncharacterized protein n=1 Tax=marine sediment metagenome TaxID=412755 RepID=A0A0F9AJV5_9ZZZZ
MAILASDIKFKYSTKLGSAGNQNTGTAAGSLGKYISTTEITSAQLNNLFDDVTGDENVASDVEYRCIFIHNAHATLTLTNTYAWLSAETASGADISISLDEAIASRVVGSSPAQAQEIANESTAPSTVTFISPTTKGAAVAVGAIGPGWVKAIWVRRTATSSAALDNDSVTIKIEGDTPA